MDNEEDDNNNSIYDMSNHQKEINKEMKKKFINPQKKTNIIFVDSPSSNSSSFNDKSDQQIFLKYIVLIYLISILFKTIVGLYIVQSHQKLKTISLFTYVFVYLYSFLWAILLVFFLLLIFIDFLCSWSSNLEDASSSSAYVLFVITIGFCYIGSIPLTILVFNKISKFSEKYVSMYIFIGLHFMAFLLYCLIVCMNIKGKNAKLEKMKQKLFALKETVMTNITNKEDAKSESDISSVKEQNESIVDESKFHKEKERVNGENLFDHREEDEYYKNLKKKIINRINSQNINEEKGNPNINNSDQLKQSKSFTQHRVIQSELDKV